MKLEINLKTISMIIAIIAILYGLLQGANVLRIDAILGGNPINGIMAIIMALLAIYGIYVSKTNLKIGAIQYILSGIGVFISIYLYGIGPAVVFIVAGVVALIAASKEEPKSEKTDKKLKIIPIVTVVLFVVFLVGTAAFAYIDSAENAKAITINGITSDISNDYGFGYTGNLKGVITIDKEFDYLNVIVEFYSANNVSLYKSYAYSGTNLKPGSYTFDGYFYEDQQPVRAEIRVYDEVSADSPIYTYSVTL